MPGISNTTNRYLNPIKNDVVQNNFAPSFAKIPNLGLDENKDVREAVRMKCNLLEVDDVCDLLKIGRSTLYGLVNKKAIKAVKLLGRTLFRPEDVMEFVASLPEYEGSANGF